MRDEKCGNCKFWFEEGLNNGGPGFSKIGQCKRYPNFVDKEEDEYCGEFKPLPGSEYLQE